jgi:hypothetical protein
MKKIFFGIIAFTSIVIAITGCEKNKFNLKDNTFITGQASLKINYFSSYQANPQYQIKIDGIRVSNVLTFATPFPGGGLNTGGGAYADYLSVAPGDRKVSITRPFMGTNNDSVELASTTVNLAAGKTYSLYFADTAANTTTILTEDDLTPADSGYTKYRFINLMPDMPTADLYFGTGSTSTTSVKIAGPIAYKAMSNYFIVPINTGTVWSIRPGGALNTTVADTSYASASSVVNQRVFTIAARGYRNVRTAADVRKRMVSFIYNR